MGQIEEFNLSIDLQNKINNSTSLPISANDVTQTPDKVFVTPSEKAMITANSNENASQTQRISTLESTINNISSTDELVKMDAVGVAGYLSELIDNLTIQNKNGKLAVEGIDGLLSTIYELNFLQGATSNIQQQINNLSGVSVFRGVFSSFSDLQDAPNPEDGQYAIVSNADSSDYYFYYNGNWEFSHNTTGSTDIDINTGTVGVLGKNRYVHQNASDTSFTDPTGQITATNTNAAIVEVFRFADSLLKGLVQTVGSPLSQTDTIENNLNNFRIWWAGLANAITNKGISASPSNNGNDMIQKIGAIPNISIDGVVKRKSKVNVAVGGTIEIPLIAPLPLTDITTTLIEFVPGSTGLVHYQLDFNNGDSGDFESNSLVEFDGSMKLVRNFDIPTVSEPWLEGGMLVSFIINQDEFEKIDEIRIKPEE